MITTPLHTVRIIEDDPQLIDGTDERFTGYGAMGVPYSGGHYLALRDMLASSVGPAYRAIWHRDPAGAWTIFTTADPDVSCPRYFGAATGVERVPVVDVTWRDEWSVDITMGTRLSWRMELDATPATRAMSMMGGHLPAWAWNSSAVLSAMGPMAGLVLRSGRIRLRGGTPNGQRFRAAPLQVWAVMGGRARMDGVDCGSPGPLPEQVSLGDFWMPQRGLFFVGRARFSCDGSGERVTRRVGRRRISA